jgi:hypothetical protein
MDPFPTLASVSADLDYPEIDAVLAKACAKKKADRWPDMTAFASALAQATPTQAGRPLSGLLSEVAKNSTPAPRRGQVSEVDDGTQGTIVRADSLAPQSRPEEPLFNKTIREQGEGQHDASVIIAPKSKAPYVVLAVAALAVLGVAGLIAKDRFASGNEVVVAPPPVAPPPLEVKPPPEAVKPPPQDGPTERDVERGRDYLARGKNAWDRGDIEEAYSYFKDVPIGTDFKPEAITFMAKVETIREKVKAGQLAQHRGDCDVAAAQFDAVLKLNAKIADARNGLTACKAATIPGKLE